MPSPGESATGNLLDGATLPAGTTASVTGFSVPGSAGCSATGVRPTAGACRAGLHIGAGTDGVRIRLAEPRDAHALAELDAQCSADGSAGWSRSLYEEELARQRPAGPALLLVMERAAPAATGHSTTCTGGAEEAGEARPAGAPQPLAEDALVQPQPEAERAAIVLVGLAAASLVVDELQVTNVALHRSARGHGLGARLVRALMDAARPPCVSAVLEVSAANARARALYAGLGFDVAGRRKRYYEDGSDALIMACTL